MKASHSDALVLFGVTGDLAHKMIFPALYAMVKRGTLPKWSLARLHKRVTESIGRSGGVDNQPALRHLLSLLKYVSGDYDHPKTFTAIKSALGRARRPAHYLAIPPSLFEMVIKGLGAADLAAHARVIVDKPFGRDLASARERWGCHHDSGRVSFRISNAQRGVERRSLHLNWFRSVTYLLISDSKIGGGCRGKNGSPFLRDKLPCRSVRFVPSGPSHRLAVSRDADANDVDRFSVAFLGLLDGVLVNALHRDHGIAEIPFEGRFRSVQLGGVTLPGRVGEVKRVAFQLHGKHERILRHVQVFCRAPGTRNGVRSLRSLCHPLRRFL